MAMRTSTAHYSYARPGGAFTVVELHRCMLAIKIQNGKPGFKARCTCSYSSVRSHTVSS